MNQYRPPILLATTGALIDSGASAVSIDFLAFSNADTVDRKVTATDVNGFTFLPGVTVRAGELTLIPLPDGGLSFKGLKVSADAGGVVTCWSRIVQ